MSEDFGLLMAADRVGPPLWQVGIRGRGGCPARTQRRPHERTVANPSSDRTLWTNRLANPLVGSTWLCLASCSSGACWWRSRGGMFLDQLEISNILVQQHRPLGYRRDGTDAGDPGRVAGPVGGLPDQSFVARRGGDHGRSGPGDHPARGGVDRVSGALVGLVNGLVITAASRCTPSSRRSASRSIIQAATVDHSYDGPAGNVPSRSSILATTGSGRSRSRPLLMLGRRRPGLVVLDADTSRLPDLRGRGRRGGRPALGHPHRHGSSCCARSLFGLRRNGRVVARQQARGGSPGVGTDGGYDLESIAAVVFGGTALAGGRGGVAGTIGGVLCSRPSTRSSTSLGVDSFFKDVVRGVVLIAAVAVYARNRRAGR